MPKKGYRQTEEHKRNNRCTEEIKQKIKESTSGENNHFFGKHHTEETKEKIRQKNLGRRHTEEEKQKMRINKPNRSGKNNHMYGKPSPHGCGRGKGCHYNSPLQGVIWLRSTYELVYAKYLDEHKILWYYEIETFDLGDTTYTPDFFLPKGEKFIEIKGYMSPKYQKKINIFLEQYPWDLEVLFKDDLIKLGIKL